MIHHGEPCRNSRKCYGIVLISHLQTSLDYNLGIGWFLCPETLSPLPCYRAKVSGESHGESLTITSQFGYIKSILI